MTIASSERPEENGMTTQQNTSASTPPRSAFIQRLTDAFSSNVDARSVYGEPIERDGITIIPVAHVRWGMGGGDGGDVEGNGGGGGGGGVSASPIGYIEIKNGDATFKPILSPATLAPLVMAIGFAGVLLFGSLRKLMRAFRR
jgi:uncharacterized spore protein YtfJ